MQRNSYKVPELAILSAMQLPLTLFTANNVVLRQKLAPILLQYVIDADWAAVKTLITKDPMLMFEVIAAEDVKDLRLVKGSRVSALGYACIMRDRYTLNIFKAACAALEPLEREHYKRTIQSFLIEEFIPTPNETRAEVGYVAFVAMVERWLTNDINHAVTIDGLRTYLLDQTHILSQQHQLYCLQPYYWVCETSLALYRREVPREKLEMFWQKIDGFAKRHLLPRHMRKQMQAQEQTFGQYHWEYNADFNENHYPTRCLVKDLRNPNRPYIDPDNDTNPADICGENYSLVRATIWGAGLSARVSQLPVPGLDLGEDLATVRRLDLVRRKEFICEQMSLGVAKKPSVSK